MLHFPGTAYTAVYATECRHDAETRIFAVKAAGLGQVKLARYIHIHRKTIFLPLFLRCQLIHLLADVDVTLDL